MLKIGMTREDTIAVDEKLTADKLGNEGVIVFSTPSMLAFLEATSRLLVADELDEGVTTLGMAVDLHHLRSTPVGMHVTCKATLTAIDGKKLSFECELRDEKEIVGRATHDRYIMPVAKLQARVAEKKRAWEEEQTK